MRKLALLCLLAAVPSGAAAPPLLLQKPTVSKTHVVFAYADDLWTVGRQGGEASRLTSGPGVETDPFFSPDGTQVAFTANYEGNVDVYVVPATGGLPRRLTYHPDPDQAVGWTPDGKRVLFRSTRTLPVQTVYSAQLFTVSAEGGFPQPVRLPFADHGGYGPDGRFAYVPHRLPDWMAWKRYRGGTTSPVWLVNLADGKTEKVPRDNSNDFCPMWVGGKVYFLSDRAGPVTLFCYDPESKKVRQVLENKGLDLKSASAGPDVLVYEQFGVLHLFDPHTDKATRIDVKVEADLPTLRPRYVKAAKFIQNAAVSPAGVRAVFEARGEILTVPVEKGSIRNLTQTSGTAERDPVWSPDGKTIAYFSDESGEYELHLRDQAGGEVRKIALGKAPSYYYSPVWSPDSKKIAYTDKRLNLWFVDLASGKSTLVDTNPYDSPVRGLDPAWSPDSEWLTYTRQLKSHFRAVFLYSLKLGKTHQVTDGLSDARFAAFDRGGKYLYFTASTDVGPTAAWLDMSSINRPVTRSVYVLVLGKDTPSPLAPESDDEKPDAQAKTDKKEDKTPQVKIDLEKIDQRILSLPVPPRNYHGLAAGKAGVLYLLEAPATGAVLFGPPRLTLHRFDLEKRKDEKLLEGLTRAELSHSGEKLLYQQGERWFLTGTSAPKPGEGALKTDDMEVRVEPRAEWAQMYRETWRIQRDFLYDPGAHGLDLKAAAGKYRPYLEGVAGRADLNYLFGEMLGELSLGHTYVMGGDHPEIKRIKGGLLGADYKVDSDRYRFAKIYQGENWNPDLRAPLTQPGINVEEGDYLLAVSGKEVRPPENLYRFFEATAGKPTLIRVGPTPDGKGARDLTVVPVESESNLRHRAWIDDNRRKVDKLSGGRVAYVYLPDTALGGFTHFNRYYFAQLDREGVVLDERYNGGGFAADHIIDHLRRPLMCYWSTREGGDFTTPLGAIFGPKVMLINETAGSGGDLMPWMFRRAKLGPLVGTRTWGGLVGVYDYPPLIDGGRVTAPRLAFWTPEGQWEVENRGVAPDLELENDPESARLGRDPQLERAVQLVLDEIEKKPVARPKKPAFPDYHKGNGRTSSR